MIKKKSETIITVTLISISLILSGCSRNDAPDTVKVNNANQVSAAPGNSSVLTNENIPANLPAAAPTSAANTDKKSSSPPANLPTPKIGSGGGDMFLFTQVRGALSSDPELLNAVIVEIKDGSATLTGSVSSEAQKAKAGQIVQGVNGVKSVKNNLRVSK